VRVKPIAEKAPEVLADLTSPQVQVLEAVMRQEDEELWLTKLPDFLIHQAPARCSTFFLRELWTHLRRCALIACLHGHDPESAETQARLYACLVLPRSNKRLQAAPPDVLVDKDEDSLHYDRVLELVSKSLARSAQAQIASKRAAGQAVNSLDVLGEQLREYSAGQRGNTLIADTPAASSTTASSSLMPTVALLAWPWSSVVEAEDDEAVESQKLSSAAAEDSEPPCPTRVAEALFKPLRWEEHPATIIFLLSLWLLPTLVSAARFATQSLYPMFKRTVRLDFSLAGLALLLLVAQVGGVALVTVLRSQLDKVACLPATVVFVAFAAAPGVSIWLATRSLLKSLAVAPCFVLLAIHSLGSGYLRWADDLLDDRTLEGRPLPSLVWGRRRQLFAVRMHRLLWGLLVADFFLEEVLGQWFGVHSIRCLGPALAPPDQEATTPAEFQSPAFLLFLVAAAAHERVLGLTKRQTVMVRMLGARPGQIPYLKLFLMGAPSVGGLHTVALGFLRDVSPSKWWCCAALFLRRWGAFGGVCIPFSLYILRDHQFLGRLSKDTLIPLSVVVGSWLGYSASSSFAAIWHECEEHLDSEYRVLYLFPHMRKSTRTWACDALCQAFRQNPDDSGRHASNDEPWQVTKLSRSVFNSVAGGLTGLLQWRPADGSEDNGEGLAAQGGSSGYGANGSDMPTSGNSSNGLRRRGTGTI